MKYVEFLSCQFISTYWASPLFKHVLAPSYTAVNQTHEQAPQVFLLLCWVRWSFQVGKSFCKVGGMGNIVIRNKNWVIEAHMENGAVGLGLITQEQRNKKKRKYI